MSEISQIVVLMRHAKTMRPRADLHDRHRPLTELGTMQALLAGRSLVGMLKEIVSSDAIRARHTADLVNVSCGVQQNVLKELYLCNAEVILELLPTLQPGTLLVGHNDGLSEVSVHLGGNFLRPSDYVFIDAISHRVLSTWTEGSSGSVKQVSALE